MRLGLMAAALAVALVPGTALAQDTVWRVLYGKPGVAVLVPDKVAATGDTRTMTIVVVLPEAAPNGSDIQYVDWAIDCSTLGLEMKGGRSFMGTQFVSNTRPRPMEITKERTLDRAVVNYACTGVTESEDNSRLNGDAAAIAYGKKIGAE